MWLFYSVFKMAIILTIISQTKALNICIFFYLHPIACMASLWSVSHLCPGSVQYIRFYPSFETLTDSDSVTCFQCLCNPGASLTKSSRLSQVKSET